MSKAGIGKSKPPKKHVHDASVILIIKKFHSPRVSFQTPGSVFKAEETLFPDNNILKYILKFDPTIFYFIPFVKLLLFPSQFGLVAADLFM